MTSTASPPASSGAPTTQTAAGGSLLLYVALGGLAFAVLQSLVAPALPILARELDASVADTSWVLTAYLLSASVLTPILGRLGDIVGKRKALIGVLVVLAIGTLLAALAPGLGVLIVARVLQGASGAIMPLSIGMIRDEMPHDKVSVSVGIVSAIAGIGAGVGIVAAGPIVEHLSWHWLFWLPLVLVVIALAGAVFAMKESPVRAPGRLDLVGAAVLTVSLLALLLAISKGQAWGWSDGKTVGLLALGVVALAALVAVESRVREPLIDMRLLRQRGVWTTDLVGLILGFAMFGTFLLIPTLLQLPESTGFGFGKSVSAAGLFLLPTVLMLIVFGVVGGILVRRFGPKVPLVVGALCVALGFLLPAIDHAALWQVLASGVLVGIGLGLAFSAMSNAIILAVPAAQTGVAIGVNNVARTVGSSVGTAVIAAVLASSVTSQGIATNGAFTAAFWTCTGAALLAVLAALALPSALARGAVDAPGTGAAPDRVPAGAGGH